MYFYMGQASLYGEKVITKEHKTDIERSSIQKPVRVHIGLPRTQFLNLSIAFFEQDNFKDRFYRETAEHKYIKLHLS